ncbi:MAG: PAS domain S-box protein [Candidatus Methanoperedens sp.]|nr:PAS domain S-box protein [Candidatus Methanoperedens sp.]
MENIEKPKLKALTDIASIDIALEFNDILQSILKITCEATGAKSGTIMLVDELDNKIRMVASYGLPRDYIERVYEAANKAGVDIASSPSGTVLETGKYYLVPNIFEEPKNKPWYDLPKELGFSSQIFTPMKKGVKVIGLLNVYWAEPRLFTDEEINFVTIAASQASSVVQNARLCGRLENNVLELEQYKEHLEDKIKETHKKLYDSERYLRTIIESSLDGILVVDEKGRFEFGNDSAFNILGWPEEELIGQFFMKVISRDLEEFMLDRWHEVQNGIEIPYETKIITKNGGVRHLYVSHARTDIKGNRKYVVVIKDISDTKNLVLNLKEDGIYTHDIEGYFRTMNDVGLRILGCAAKEEVIGSHISKWLTPESFEVAKEVIIKYVSGEPLKQPITLEIICKNGEHVWVEFRNRIIKDGDRIVAIHGIGRDITEKRRMEQQLKEYHEELKKSYEELKEADRIKTEFISNITHELMTPLTSIKGFVELLDDGAIGSINEDQKKSLVIIHRNSERLIHLIKELLDISHLEKNTLGMQFGLVSINDILSKCILDLQPLAKEKQISLFQDALPLPRIRGDEERLTQVIINLLANAIKFTPNDGKITVISRDLTEQVKISIRDTGIGIPGDQLSRIFERFYQIDGSAKRKYGGTGIGLSICKNVIEKHYGSIWAESDGNGSTFHILLPKLKSGNGVGNVRPES